MTREQLVDRLKAAGKGELLQAHRATGVAYSAIRSIRDGTTKNPRIDTFDKLASHFSRVATH